MNKLLMMFAILTFPTLAFTQADGANEIVVTAPRNPCSISSIQNSFSGANEGSSRPTVYEYENRINGVVTPNCATRPGCVANIFAPHNVEMEVTHNRQQEKIKFFINGHTQKCRPNPNDLDEIEGCTRRRFTASSGELMSVVDCVEGATREAKCEDKPFSQETEVFYENIFDAKQRSLDIVCPPDNCVATILQSNLITRDPSRSDIRGLLLTTTDRNGRKISKLIVNASSIQVFRDNRGYYRGSTKFPKLDACYSNNRRRINRELRRNVSPSALTPRPSRRDGRQTVR